MGKVRFKYRSLANNKVYCGPSDRVLLIEIRKVLSAGQELKLPF